MDSPVLITVTVLLVILAVGAILLSLFLYLRHRKAKQKLAEAKYAFDAQQFEKSQKAKKGWKHKFMARKTIKYVFKSEASLISASFSSPTP